METKLLPCPFCGCEAEVTFDDTPGRIIVMCTSCETRTDWFYNKDIVIDIWNTRHGKTCDGCRYLATSMIIDYHIDPCCECVRNAPDLYEPKEDTDADGA